MTREEFISEYGNTPVDFHVYHKLKYFYKGITTEGNMLTVVYLSDIETQSTYKLTKNDDMLLNTAALIYGKVVDNDMNIIAEFNI